MPFDSFLESPKTEKGIPTPPITSYDSATSDTSEKKPATQSDIISLVAKMSLGEVLSLQKMAIGDPDTFYRELRARFPGTTTNEGAVLKALTQALWESDKATFLQKFSAIQELQDGVSSDYEYFGEIKDASQQSLEFISAREKNFFLRKVCETFLQETYPDYSVEERREMIQRQWKTNRSYKNGETIFWSAVSSYTVPRKPRSAEDLEEPEVKAISKLWADEDKLWFSPQVMRESELRGVVWDPALNRKVITGSQLKRLSPVEDPENACYDLAHEFSGEFFSSISADFGALYQGSELGPQEVFKKDEKIKTAPFTTSNLANISQFLVDLKQAAPADGPYLRKTYRELRHFFQERSGIDQMVTEYLSQLDHSKQKFHDRGDHEQAYAVIYNKQGEKSFDEIFFKVTQYLRDKIEPSAIKTVSLEKIISESLERIGSKIPPQSMAALYMSFASVRMRTYLENFFGFSFSKIPLSSQLQFLNYVWDKDEDDVQKVRAFVSQSQNPEGKAARFMSFLSLEQGGEEMAEKILSIGKRFEEAVSAGIFAKYSEIVSQISAVETALGYEKGLSRDATGKIAGALLKRAKDLLVTFAGTEENDPDRLLAQLEKIRGDIELFKTAFKTLKESGAELSLEDIRVTEFGIFQGKPLETNDPLAKEQERERSKMRLLYEESVQGYPEEVRIRLLTEFNACLNDQNSAFRIFRYKGEVAGFACFTETEPGRKYVSAVTLDPRFHKAYIGEAMIDQAFKQEAQENILAADCVAQKSVSARYIENGFVGLRTWNDHGDLILDIVRDDGRNARYFTSKSLEQEEIIRQASLEKQDHMRIEVVDDPKEHSFSLCNEGFVLTRYFKHADTKKWYLVYEPHPKERQVP